MNHVLVVAAIDLDDVNWGEEHPGVVSEKSSRRPSSTYLGGNLSVGLTESAGIGGIVMVL